MASGDRLTREEVLAAFDEHLRRTRGVCVKARRNYARFVRASPAEGVPESPVDAALIQAREVAGFVGGLTSRYQPRLPAAGRVDRCWDVVRADGVSTVSLGR